MKKIVFAVLTVFVFAATARASKGWPNNEGKLPNQVIKLPSWPVYPGQNSKLPGWPVKKNPKLPSWPTEPVTYWPGI